MFTRTSPASVLSHDCGAGRLQRWPRAEQVEGVRTHQKRDVSCSQDGHHRGEESVTEQTRAPSSAPATTHSNASWSQTDELNK